MNLWKDSEMVKEHRVKHVGITRRKFLSSISLGAAMSFSSGNINSFSSSSSTSKGPNHSRPNIIFILADDMGYNDMSIMGQTNFKTPALDRMAKEGMLFTDHYAGSTVCAPSRATLLTGNHTGRVYQRGNGSIEFRQDPQDITIASRLKQAGYHTAMIGKSGVACNSDNVTLPNDKGFDHFFGFIAHGAAHRFYPRQLTRNGKQVKYPANDGHTGKVYSGDIILDNALDYLDLHGKDDKPFFLHLAIQQPHADLSVPEEFRSPFIGQFEEDPGWIGGFRETRYPAATYAGMIISIDHGVRRILQKLYELQIEENTLVIFSSDNGSHSAGGYHYRMHDSNAPLRGGKRDLYEGGIRVPMIAWWPGTIKAGSKTDHLSAFWDFPATALEIAGQPVPEDMDGISYLPTLLGKADQQIPHKYLYWEFYEQGGKQAVRYGKWKGVRLNVKENRHGPIELYNLADDIGESTDLADRHPDITGRIAELMEKAHHEPESDLFNF